jgi:hypothetical protein
MAVSARGYEKRGCWAAERASEKPQRRGRDLGFIWPGAPIRQKLRSDSLGHPKFQNSKLRPIAESYAPKVTNMQSVVLYDRCPYRPSLLLQDQMPETNFIFLFWTCKKRKRILYLAYYVWNAVTKIRYLKH